MDIGLDLQRAYDDGYKKGWEDAEAYALHCGDTDEPQTNADRIRAMSDEVLAKFISGKARTFGEEYEGYLSALEWLKEEADDADI